MKLRLMIYSGFLLSAFQSMESMSLVRLVHAYTGAKKSSLYRSGTGKGSAVSQRKLFAPLFLMGTLPAYIDTLKETSDLYSVAVKLKLGIIPPLTIENVHSHPEYKEAYITYALAYYTYRKDTQLAQAMDETIIFYSKDVVERLLIADNKKKRQLSS